MYGIHSVGGFTNDADLGMRLEKPANDTPNNFAVVNDEHT
jgi:hypothetical protein